MFEIKNVSKQFGSEYALKNVSMNIGSGMNFIVGSSGSGKTTLLKIISAMEQDYDGDASYCGENMKSLSEQEKSYYYNNILGFVWQDFNLLDNLTVWENVVLSQYVKHIQEPKEILKILRELKISELIHQKVGKLSGGQKQRVAIARELVKNPQVLIADEPTSALDESSAKITMNILRNISKNRAVIVVTHDTSLIDGRSKVYELDKGELIKSAEVFSKEQTQPNTNKYHKLAMGSAVKLGIGAVKSMWGRAATTSLSLIVAATLLLVTVSGAIADSSQSEFQKLFDTYGKSILDIDVVGSFVSAGGTDGAKNDEPSANVDQEIDGLYDKYLHDDRISHIVYSQPYSDIKIITDGKEYNVEKSNSVPVIDELISGTMPMGDGNEVVISKSFLEQMGGSEKSALGKTIDFSGSIYNWDSGEPVSMPVKITATIVGVVDSTVKYDSGEKIEEYSVPDSFFFSQTAVRDMRAQAKMSDGESNFTIRTKTPADMIEIKDEINADGIVPLGRFELVEDMVRLNNQSTQQSTSAIIVIAILAVVSVLAVALTTALTRKREYAIFKVCGYANKHLLLAFACEFLILSIGSALLFLCTSPIINLATTGFWNVNILSGKFLGTGVMFVFVMGLITYTATALCAITTKASNALKTGDR